MVVNSQFLIIILTSVVIFAFIALGFYWIGAF